MNNILIYTFFRYSSKTSKGLYELDTDRYHIDKLFIPHTFSTKKLLEAIPKYDYIIGIADHNKNAIKSRFDPRYVNMYGKKTILEKSTEEYISNWDIVLPEGFYEYKSTTNGPCNRSAYLIMNKIEKEKLNTKFGFFHLNKKCVEEDIRKLLYCCNMEP